VLLLTLTLALLGNLASEPAPTTAELAAQIDEVLETPETARAAELERLIGELEQWPLALLSNKALAKQLLRARVVVAWAQREPERAAAAIDEAIRSAAGRKLPLSGLGSEFESLAKQRTAVLERGGTASIEVACWVPCQVLVNERRSVNPTDPLLLGKYRVWVVSNDGQVEPLRTDVELDVTGETERIEFGRVYPVPPPPGIVMASELEQDSPIAPAETPRKRKRSDASLLPLWAEIVGIIAGAGLVGTGVGLLAIDGRCKGGGDPTICPTLIETTAPGAALSALGSATLLTFGSVIGLDRLQLSRLGQPKSVGASVGWSFRF
jgi:hypothetical protein